jgi:hypothetical protein
MTAEINNNVKVRCSICNCHTVTGKDTIQPICIKCFDTILTHPEYSLDQIKAERIMQDRKPGLKIAI